MIVLTTESARSLWLRSARWAAARGPSARAMGARIRAGLLQGLLVLMVVLAPSLDGALAQANCGDGPINTSDAQWTARESNRDWNSITLSSDGTKLAAVRNTYL